ncbi:hypothetical protein PR048_028150 [Dryococelus australis]|uniref:Uncharacterized protein n=1 Tax=Dryococelus australis TaxID=614101 RepID=A0ABQ9GIG7_9NEOP|nr:hypothetical protein PR048_028150 [Dryococelus australis]
MIKDSLLGQDQLGSPLVDDRPIMKAIKCRVVSGEVRTNRKMVSSNTETNRTGVLAVVDIVSSFVYKQHGRNKPTVVAPSPCAIMLYLVQEQQRTSFLACKCVAAWKRSTAGDAVDQLRARLINAPVCRTENPSHFNASWRFGDAVTRLLAFHQSEPDSIPGKVNQISHVGNVAGVTVCRLVLSGYSLLSPCFHSAAASSAQAGVGCKPTSRPFGDVLDIQSLSSREAYISHVERTLSKKVTIQKLRRRSPRRSLFAGSGAAMAGWVDIDVAAVICNCQAAQGVSHPTRANRVQSPAGSLRIFASGNRDGRCRWSAGFLPPLHSGAAPFSFHFTLIGSQDLVKKTIYVACAPSNHNDRGSHRLQSQRSRLALRRRIGFLYEFAGSEQNFTTLALNIAVKPPGKIHLSLQLTADLPWRSRLVRHRSGVREDLGSNPGQGMGTLRWSGPGIQGLEKREYPEKTRRQAASSSTSENPEANPPGIEPGSLWWEASALATAPPLPLFSRAELIAQLITKHVVIIVVCAVDSSYRWFSHVPEHFEYKVKLYCRIGSGGNQLAMMQVAAPWSLRRQGNSHDEALRHGHMKFMQSDTLKNRTEICKDSSFESQQVMSISPAALMGGENDHKESTDENEHEDSDSVEDDDGDFLDALTHPFNTFAATSYMKNAEDTENTGYLFPEGPNQLFAKDFRGLLWIVEKDCEGLVWIGDWGNSRGLGQYNLVVVVVDWYALVWISVWIHVWIVVD